jgi:hypothetical protein
MNVPDHEVHSTSVVFKWPTDFELENFYCVYHKVMGVSSDTEDAHIVKIPIASGSRNTINVSNLKGDATTYTMCFFHESVLVDLDDDEKLRSILVSTNKNCGLLVTSYGGGICSFIAKIVLVAMVLSVIGLIVARGK